MAKTNVRFSIFCLSHRLYRGSEVQRWGLKTHFNFFLKGIFAQEGSSGTRFDHGQIENKTFSIYAPPNYLARPILISSVKFIFLGQPTTNLTAERFQEIVRQWIDSGGGDIPI